MPAARALARAEGADLAAVRATGQGGVVQRADVARHLEARAPRPGWERLSGPRRAMARRMAQGGGVVPATVQDVADVTPWISPEADVLVRLVRACAAGARAAPALNAWYDPERIERRLHDGLDLGIAVNWEEGLSVPVIRGAESLGAAALRAEADRLIAAVRDRRIAPEAARGATLTLSNFGPLGGRHGALVVSPPEVAILGAGRAFEHVVWGANGPGRGVALPLSLSFDHRAATGGDAARFLAAAIADLERPD
jgi:pyruvate dehydrogenase E2 component (dihydrolipoamide acetyltransferase)